MKKLNKIKQSIATMGLVTLLSLVGSCRKPAVPTNQAAVDSGDAQASASSIAEADQLYAQRGDLAKARMAVAALRQARTADYGNYEAAWKLARADYYLGSHTSGNEADEAFREGVQAGKTAIQLNGDRPEGHFWLGANYGGSAEHSTLAGLSSFEDIRREMETVIKMDETFQGGSAYLALGQLYLESPRVLGGDTAKAIGYLEKGLKIAPDNALMRVQLAEAYHTAGRDAEARKQIDQLMAMTPHPDYVPEYQDAVDKGKKLLEKMKQV
ncbi:MAG: hypothetical protein C5B44_03220 [Acidobacteria bacterium]|nr:MAG: hypothetical protein C5B44_03220 [Acidobacteriota bacterium]